MLMVDAVVNCYERTYRAVLTPGFFRNIERQNCVAISGRIALVNNVLDPEDARLRADDLASRGEITGWAFVADRLPDALRVTHVPRRCVRRRGYFLDFGLAMTVTGDAPYLLGWDAEAGLDRDEDWLTLGIELLQRRGDVFSVAPGWPKRQVDSLPLESVARDGPWFLNYGFSDQMFLVRRHEIAAPIFRRFAPAAVVRNSPHPRSFETRVEAYQRATGRFRASLGDLRHVHNDLGAVLDRIGDRTVRDRAEKWALDQCRHALTRLSLESPRWRLP